MIAAAGSAEQLAGVLAHEVQHVEHRHTLQQMIHTAGWAAVLAVLLAIRVYFSIQKRSATPRGA